MREEEGYLKELRLEPPTLEHMLRVAQRLQLYFTMYDGRQGEVPAAVGSRLCGELAALVERIELPYGDLCYILKKLPGVDGVAHDAPAAAVFSGIMQAVAEAQEAFAGEEAITVCALDHLLRCVVQALRVEWLRGERTVGRGRALLLAVTAFVRREQGASELELSGLAEALAPLVNLYNSAPLLEFDEGERACASGGKKYVWALG